MLPGSGVGLWFRLNAATLAVLLPGIMVARALGVRGLAAALSWSLTAVGVGLAVVFVVRTTLSPVLWLLAAVLLLALPFATRIPGSSRRALEIRVVVGAVGVLVGIAIWFVAGIAWGDELFHLARVEKLVALNRLSLHRVDEFRDGGLHPGYAFPLWHGFLAVVARLAGASPTAVVLHEPSALSPIAALLAYEAGAAVFRSRVVAVAFVFASLVPLGFAAGRGGSLVSLSEPGTAARLLLVPAIVALFFRSLQDRRATVLLTLAATNAALALIHPPYALFLLLAFLGFALARTLIRPRELKWMLPALSATSIAIAAVFVWLRPIAKQSIAYRPTAAERLREIARYGDELVVSNAHRFALSPQLFARTGAFAVAALTTLPLAAAALPRRWSSWVLAAGLPLFTLLLLKPVFPHFAALVSLSQARRAAAFVPLPYAFTAAAAITCALIGAYAIPIALGAGIALQLAFPGDFSAIFKGAPGWPVWIAFAGGAAAIVLARVLRPPHLRLNRLTVIPATLAFLIPIVVHGFRHWQPVVSRDQYALTPGLARELNRLPRGTVVFSDPATSYRIAALAPVYIVAGPPSHVANTKANAPLRRERDALAFYRSGDLTIPRRYGAQWIVVDRTRFHLQLRLPIDFRDRRFTLYKLAGSPVR